MLSGYECDITSYITAPGKYSLSVKSKGDFEVGADGRYNIDSLGSKSEILYRQRLYDGRVRLYFYLGDARECVR